MKHKRFYLLGFCLLCFNIHSKSQQVITSENDVRKYISDSCSQIKKRPLLAATEVFSTNMFVWGFNDFIMNEDFAKISFKTIKHNLSYFPVWDTDKFSTNLLAHPYHGSLYFNAARSNGLSFWQSVPYAFGGSLMWEYCMENELPSMNDLYATTLGGICLGEITFRLSDLFIDNTTRGFDRFCRELIVACISPVRGINRLLNKESFTIQHCKGRTFNYVPVYFNVFTGGRFLSEYGKSKQGETSLNLGFNIIYGEPFKESYGTYYKPYEWFTLNCDFDLLSHQPLVSQINAMGILWGKNLDNSDNDDFSLTTGLFQHFDFYNSSIKNSKNETVSPYRISEAVAYGPGILFYKHFDNKKIPFSLRSTLYANGIVLGGNITDHFFENERDYNLGSGFSIKTYGGITFNKKLSFDLSVENYHIYTWKETSQKGFNSTQGDKGNSRLTVISPYITYLSNKRWSIVLRNRQFLRHTHYENYDDVDFKTTDFVLTFNYTL
ncbi:MAG: DUF3943 domain-containing protein [Bacteroidales bacterium]|jgi:hypothetical protein|nr:DUF3943 domain-containing protein [Bacteroidales bacterium]